MTEKKEEIHTSRDHIMIGSIYIEFGKDMTFRDIEYMRRVLIAIKYTDSVLDENGHELQHPPHQHLNYRDEIYG